MRFVVALAGVSLVLALAAAGASADDFVAYQGDIGRSGYQPAAGVVPPLEQRWAIDLPLPLTNPALGQPRIAKGRAFVTAAKRGGPCLLYALDLETGRILWGPVSTGGDGHRSDAAYDGGRVFVLSDSGDVTAWSAETGNLLWHVALGGIIATSPIVATHGHVYINLGSLLIALDEVDGARLWSQPIRAFEQGGVVADADGVYVAEDSAYAYKFTHDGAPVWSRVLDTFSGGGGRTPMLAGGRLYVPMHVDPATVLSASSGAALGTFAAGRMPASDGVTTVYSEGMPLDGQTLVARDAITGNERWRFAGDGQLTTAPLIAGDVVYVGSWTGTLYALSLADGRLLWSADIGAGSNIPPPDEQNGGAPIQGPAAAEGRLLVPLFDQTARDPKRVLVAYASVGAPPTYPEPDPLDPPGPPGVPVAPAPDAALGPPPPVAPDAAPSATPPPPAAATSAAAPIPRAAPEPSRPIATTPQWRQIAHGLLLRRAGPVRLARGRPDVLHTGIDLRCAARQRRCVVRASVGRGTVTAVLSLPPHATRPVDIALTTAASRGVRRHPAPMRLTIAVRAGRPPHWVTATSVALRLGAYRPARSERR
jgi:outer membrane protein assembly factor BamB